VIFLHPTGGTMAKEKKKQKKDKFAVVEQPPPAVGEAV
jgi:hypothetical protein